MRIGAIIQARSSSKRLPNKVFEKIGDKTVVERIIRALRKCKNLDRIILAAPTKDMEKFRSLDMGRDLTVPLEYTDFYGSENDVLMRMIKAAKKEALDVVVRVCADSPFILPWLIDVAIETYKDNSQIDYLVTQNFPQGQNIEIVKLSALVKAHKKATKEEKEHVTLYLENHYKDFNCRTLKVDLTLDTAEDLAALRKVAKYYD